MRLSQGVFWPGQSLRNVALKVIIKAAGPYNLIAQHSTLLILNIKYPQSILLIKVRNAEHKYP